MVTVATSGGFDPVHIGHLKLFKEAKKLGDKLVVILNGDGWLKRKKGAIFMPQLERKAILKAIKYIDEVIIWDDGSENVNGALKKIRPNIFAKGGDRDTLDKVPEAQTCQEIGCKIVFNVGGGKVCSSSQLLRNYCRLTRP